MSATFFGTERVIFRFTAISDGVHGRMVQIMGSVANDISTYVKDNKLSGQVLQVRSGRLRRSVNGTTQDGGTQVSAVVRTNLVYAAPHEYGCNKTVNVPAHTRMQTMAWGKPMTARMVEVCAHPMRMNLPERSFLRSSLHETAPGEIDYIRRSMGSFIQETIS
jgi:phage gpG-like protein